jgi:hypothetical protein
VPDVACATGQLGKFTFVVADVIVKVEVLFATDVVVVRVCLRVVGTVLVMEVDVLLLTETKVLVDV